MSKSKKNKGVVPGSALPGAELEAAAVVDEDAAVDEGAAVVDGEDLEPDEEESEGEGEGDGAEPDEDEGEGAGEEPAAAVDVVPASQSFVVRVRQARRIGDRDFAAGDAIGRVEVAGSVSWQFLAGAMERGIVSVEAED